MPQHPTPLRRSNLFQSTILKHGLLEGSTILFRYSYPSCTPLESSQLGELKWAGLCEKGPYGCSRGFEISRDKVRSIKMMSQYDDETLIACCAMMTHDSNMWSVSFESHCSEVFCSFDSLKSVTVWQSYVCFKCWLLLSSSQILCQSWLYESSHNSTKKQDFYKRFSTM